MKGRRGKEEEEELEQKIRSLLEEGKTYEEVEKETRGEPTHHCKSQKTDGKRRGRATVHP